MKVKKWIQKGLGPCIFLMVTKKEHQNDNDTRTRGILAK